MSEPGLRGEGAVSGGPSENRKNRTLSQLGASLQKGEWVYFKDFGSFTRKTRSGRHVRHPKTGQLIWIPPRPDVDFNPAKDLLKAKRRGGSAPGGKTRAR